MASAKYYVFKEGDRWTVRYDGKEYPYDSNSDAVLAAIKAANGAASNGYEAEVLVQGVDLKWRTEWASSYGCGMSPELDDQYAFEPLPVSM